MIKKTNRDDFTEGTKTQIAKRAGYLCSYPSCRNTTVGATSDDEGVINVGTAAHICAAAPGGPRFDKEMTTEERRSVTNGIWVCADHGRAVDSSDSEFTVACLREWKKQAEQESRQRVLRNETTNGLIALSLDFASEQLRNAAKTDFEKFRRAPNWPSTSVVLSLKVDGFDEPVTTIALANAVISLDDLILVASPGMGKTTTLFQIAQAILDHGSGTPLVVPLGDWATDSAPVLSSVLNRPAFRGISEDIFRAVAAKPGVVLLLDGWNELDSAARQRARVQIEGLKAELPELGLVISTRKQALNVPFTGMRADLLPLNDEQQMAIAIAMRGDAGAHFVDQAWRTAGVRDLVTIPLYLTTLLALPEGAPFPTTKEEVLRRFVAVHEEDARKAEMFRTGSHGLHQDYMEDIAAFATGTSNTSLTEADARRSITDTETRLLENGQIALKSQPDVILNLLVSNHVLMRTGEMPGYSFQHQQFQEWYASHFVERLMMMAESEVASRDKLKADILNRHPWEEAILFAVERLARGNDAQQRSCAAALLFAFEVDPILAAEMIFRATDAVWGPVGSEIQKLVRSWHASGKVDRAVRFMIASGRAEFLDLVWPLITHEDQQIRFAVLRAGKRFRTSILGNNGASLIAALPPEIKRHVICEIASNSGLDGLDLATLITKADSDPELKADVVDTFDFRRADRHISQVMETADDLTFDLVAARGLVENIHDKNIQNRLEAARERQRQAGVDPFERLRSLRYAIADERLNEEVTAIIANMEIDRKQDGAMHLLHDVRNRYPLAVAEGLLIRVREGRELIYGTDDILASANFSLEDDSLVEIALAETQPHDARSEAAASVLGPASVARLIEVFLEARSHLRDDDGRNNQKAVDHYHNLQRRIEHTPGTSLVAGVQARAALSDIEDIEHLAKLLSRGSGGDDGRARPFSAEAKAAIVALSQEWGEKMLRAGDATNRRQTASLATLISHVPSVTLLPLLERLLDDNLRRLIAFREAAAATGWRHGPARDEAASHHTDEYRRAFLAIKAPETASLMEKYLADEHFGESAAEVIAKQWNYTNEPADEGKFRRGVDFSRIKDRRSALMANPSETSAEAEAIFRVIDVLLAEGATQVQTKLAVSLGIVALRLPHGQREETIAKLISLAPRQSRAALLLSLILAGEEIDTTLVIDGILEVYEAAKRESWILTQGDAYQVKDWLRLLPFTSHPTKALASLGGLPDDQRSPHFFENMVAGFAHTPTVEAEEFIFKLAESDERFYANHDWRDTIVRWGTISSARRLIDLTAQGAFGGRSSDNWHYGKLIGELIGEHPELRAYVYGLLKDGPSSIGLTLLADAITENPDTGGLLLLVGFESEKRLRFVNWRTVESVVTEHLPIENWMNSYEVVPVPAIELRQKLLMMINGERATDPATRCLNLIDKVRDQYGVPESEPRHPDLASGRPWPIMTPDPRAEAAS